MGVNKVRGKGRGWRELLPNRSFWSSAVALVLDGVMFTRETLRGRSSSRPDSGAAPLLKVADSKRDRKRSESSHSKTVKKKKASREQDPEKKEKRKDKKDVKGGLKASPSSKDPDPGSPTGGGPGWAGNAAELQEERDTTVHSSQAKIKVVV